MSRNRITYVRVQLEERSPTAVLKRGYAIATDAAGNVLLSAEQVGVGENVTVKLHLGSLLTEVKSKRGE